MIYIKKNIANIIQRIMFIIHILLKYFGFSKQIYKVKIHKTELSSIAKSLPLFIFNYFLAFQNLVSNFLELCLISLLEYNH